MYTCIVILCVSICMRTVNIKQPTHPLLWIPSDQNLHFGWPSCSVAEAQDRGARNELRLQGHEIHGRCEKLMVKNHSEN